MSAKGNTSNNHRELYGNLVSTVASLEGEVRYWREKYEQETGKKQLKAGVGSGRHRWQVVDASEPGSFKRKGEFFVIRQCVKCGCLREDNRNFRTYTMDGKDVGSRAPKCIPRSVVLTYSTDDGDLESLSSMEYSD
jgi:hypothetical protein